MGLKINDGSTGLWINQQLNKSEKGLNKSLERLSTGRRINRAADDASGLAIVDHLDSFIKGIEQALRNANDALSITQISDGALHETTSIIQRVKTLAIQASNDTLSTENRRMIQADIDKLLAQVDMSAETTQYNGRSLLSGEFSDQHFQVGAGSNETVALSIPSTRSGNLGGSEAGYLSDVDVTTYEGAQAAIDIADTALEKVSLVRSGIGSVQNQIKSTIQNLSSSLVNSAASQSNIRDVDFADESTNFSKLKLLVQSKVFALAQSNTSSRNVLKLLQQ